MCARVCVNVCVPESVLTEREGVCVCVCVCQRV